MIKLIGEEEYKAVCSWWEHHGFPVVPPQSLPSTGYMICDDSGVGIWACYLYLMQEGNFGWLEFIVSNPKAPNEIKQDALAKLLDVVTRIAGEMGVGILMTGADRNKPRYIERLVKTGFFDSGESVAHLIKVIPRSEPCQLVEPQPHQQ